MDPRTNNVPFDKDTFFKTLSSTNSSSKKNPEMDGNRIFVIPDFQKFQNDVLSEASFDFTEFMDMDNIPVSQGGNGELQNSPQNLGV